MRTSHFLPTFFAATLLVGLTAPLRAALPDVSGSAAPRLVEKDEYRDATFGKLRGTGVQGADGKQLGKVHDLVLDARSGEPKFVVVSAGFMGMGGHLRLLPYDALIREPRGHDFITRLQRVDWDLLPIVDKADIDEGRVVLTSEQRRTVGQLRDQRWAQSFDSLAKTDQDTADARRFVFASSLADKRLYADGKEVGKVEDLFVAPQASAVSAIVRIDDDYIGRRREFLVPVSALQVPAGKSGRVHTTLAAADFQQAAGVPVAANSDAGRWTPLRDRHADRDRRDQAVDTRRVPPPRDDRSNTALAPTGAPSGYRDTDRAATGGLDAAAQAIRDTWFNNPALNRHALRVNVANDRLVLDGTVPTERLRVQAEESAQRVTSGVTIENRIRVQE